MLQAPYEDGDLITIEDTNGKVHIIWTDSKYGKRICRPSMIDKGTGRRDEIQWKVLKKGIVSRKFTDEIKNLRKPFCQECLNLCPGAK